MWEGKLKRFGKNTKGQRLTGRPDKHTVHFCGMPVYDHFCSTFSPKFVLQSKAAVIVWSTNY